MSGHDQRAIVDALVGEDPRRIYAYQNSVHFRRAVDTLAGMLPAMVGGLLDEAMTADMRDLHRERMLRATPASLYLDGLIDPPPSV